eukprot:12392270-Alexandrium_andersonii.AAC.1
MAEAVKRAEAKAKAARDISEAARKRLAVEVWNSGAARVRNETLTTEGPALRAERGVGVDGRSWTPQACL